MSARPEKRALARLYKQIPAFTCKPGCADCCGPVPTSPVERVRAPRLAGIDLRLALTACLTCPYSTDAGCAVYADRPFICRLFGAVEGEPKLACPHGCKPERPLSAAKAEALTMEYMRLTGDA